MIFSLVISICVILYLIDKFCLWLEEKGLLYYRKQKPQSSGLIGNTLLELHNIFNPNTQHIIEVKHKTEVNQSKQNVDENEK
ncbi:MAG: hypothetical protein AB7V32_01785 [Candidatus Berkiella sp.]